MKGTSVERTRTLKFYEEESIFKPENLLREARRQMEIPEGEVPDICVLDPDGDLVTYLKEKGLAEKDPYWACYHSSLYDTELKGRRIGIIPCAVGAPYATLVAEQLFVSGCERLVSITSAGIVQDEDPPKDFALITEALRDEGTSYHYQPSDRPSRPREHLLDKLREKEGMPWFEAKSWTTDTPYRETPSALEAMKADGVTCVEMEAAALYAFAAKREREVLCFAHLTNTMAQNEGDFEKGEAFGSLNALHLLEHLIDDELNQKNENR